MFHIEEYGAVAVWHRAGNLGRNHVSLEEAPHEIGGLGDVEEMVVVDAGGQVAVRNVDDGVCEFK